MSRVVTHAVRHSRSVSTEGYAVEGEEPSASADHSSMRERICSETLVPREAHAAFQFFNLSPGTRRVICGVAITARLVLEISRYESLWDMTRLVAHVNAHQVVRRQSP